MSEEALYEPIREFLLSKFSEIEGDCYLEITANGHFSETFKKAVQQDIVFAFLKRGVSPDLTGFITKGFGIQDFITVEIKSERITIKDIAQAKLYGDIFSARYAFLISPRPIPEEIKRLHQNIFILSRFTSNYDIFLGELQFEWRNHRCTGACRVIKENWFPASPFLMFGLPILIAKVATTQTQLLAVMSSRFHSISDLRRGAKIAISEDQPLLWMQTALATYNISFMPIMVPKSDLFKAISMGILDAVLIGDHPSQVLKEAISSGKVRLLPWSNLAIETLIRDFPTAVRPSVLPQDTYTGQSESIQGYSPY